MNSKKSGYLLYDFIIGVGGITAFSVLLVWCVLGIIGVYPVTNANSEYMMNQMWTDRDFSNGEKVCSSRITLSEAERIGLGNCTADMLKNCNSMTCYFTDSPDYCYVWYDFPVTEHSDPIDLEKLTCMEWTLVWR